MRETFYGHVDKSNNTLDMLRAFLMVIFLLLFGNKAFDLVLSWYFSLSGLFQVIKFGTEGL